MSDRLGAQRASGFAVGLWTLASLAWAQLAPLPFDQGGVGLGLALRRLPTTARVLYVTAHPDDEDNAALVALSRGRGVRTALLTLTRGEGGQNAIGGELFEALGVLRTEELLAVHRYDGVEQYFTRAYEFGFSYSLEETLAKWGHRETLGDVVRTVRAFRPDVILTLPLEGRDHQHHTAAARLAVEAFRAAGDPERFPEQLTEGLRPWQARKIYQGGVGGAGGGAPPGAVVLDIGRDDPLLGMSWAEFGSLARSFHRCQAARQLLALPGERREARFLLVDAEPPQAGAESDILDGLDTSLHGLLRFVPDAERPRLDPDLRELDAAAQDALAVFDAREPGRCVTPLARGLAAVRRLEAAARAGGSPGDAELRFRLLSKEEDLTRALTLAQGLVLEATSDDGDVAPGQTLQVTVRAFNRGSGPVALEGLDLRAPTGWEVRSASAPEAPAGALGAERGLRRAFAVKVAPHARPSQPYWRRGQGPLERYEVDLPEQSGLPFGPPDLLASLRWTVAGLPLTLERPVVVRYEGRWVGGEKQKVVNVVPALSVAMSPDLAVFPLTGDVPARRELRVSVRSNVKGEASASLRLLVPPGWGVEPAAVALHFRLEGDEMTTRFEVAPKRPLAAGVSSLSAVATLGGEEFREGYQVIAYDHIQERHLFHAATARGLALDVRVRPGTSVGYVMGVGDEVPEAIRQLGVPVTLLGPDDLAFADLRRYSTIVTGVRAYHARPDLRSHQDRLMRYVAEGGNLLVQYNRWEFNQLAPAAAPEEAAGQGMSPFAPYPARVTTNRITDETAAIEVLVPASPVLTSPNRITERDWEGWVQERGIQFLETRDPRYVDLLAATDPFPLNPGRKTGILVEARVGKGTWTYTGLVLFRELPAGIPGAYRLLANLISRPRGR